MKVPLPSNPKKKLGQNFLIDENVIQKILNYFHPSSSDHVLEIGAGTGALTSVIAPLTAKWTAVEIDASLVSFIESIKNVNVIHADILDVDLESIAQNGKLRILGNLPYYISSPILMRLIRNLNYVQDMTLMFQEEVAQRIIAPVSGSEYGLLSVTVQYYCFIDKGFRISRNSFRPRPEIASRIMKLIPIQNKALKPQDYIDLLQKAFSQRRKKLRNNLLRTLEVNPSTLDSIFEKLKLDQNVRAENLSPALFESLILELSSV